MRIGINVPNELLTGLEPIREVANVSQICRDAIQSWVDTYGRALARAKDDGMGDVANRLWQEYADNSVDWEALGHEDAKLWVQLASLEDFENLFHNLKVKKREGRSHNWIPFYRRLEGAKTFGTRENEYKEWFYRQNEIDLETNHHEVAETNYSRSWICYVTAVWRMAKDRIAAELKTQKEALRDAQTKAELPVHLAGRKSV